MVNSTLVGGGYLDILLVLQICPILANVLFVSWFIISITGTSFYITQSFMAYPYVVTSYMFMNVLCDTRPKIKTIVLADDIHLNITQFRPI